MAGDRLPAGCETVLARPGPMVPGYRSAWPTATSKPDPDTTAHTPQTGWRSLLKGAARRLANPADVLADVNRELCRENQTLMFVTLICGILNIKTGEVLYANAGHNPPLLIRKAQKAVFLNPFRALMLGGFTNAEYRTEVLHLEPGDSLFLYTDGVTEARNEDRDFYTAERLQTKLSKLNQASPLETIEA